jgi:hypothetical protein
MTRVNLPPGCSGFDTQDGTRYTAKRPGGVVEVSEHHASAIETGQFGGNANLLTATGAVYVGTKKGRQCLNCPDKRVWNVWNATCPKCGEPTVDWCG